MRGKVSVKLDALATAGITPAYAGKRYCLKDRLTRSEDHPRLCGEKRIFVVSYSYTSGITPAYAGKSPVWTHRTPSCQDHPRLCGEKKDTRRRKWRQSGSPPPMRGKEQMRGMSGIFYRITPAYAGKSAAVCGAANLG